MSYYYIESKRMFRVLSMKNCHMFTLHFETSHNAPVSGRLPPTACELLADGVTAIFGPMSRTSAGHVQSICDHVAIPHIETRWDSSQPDINQFAINIHPHYDTLAHAYLDYVVKMGWSKFTILYDNPDGKLNYFLPPKLDLICLGVIATNSQYFGTFFLQR